MRPTLLYLFIPLALFASFTQAPAAKERKGPTYLLQPSIYHNDEFPQLDSVPWFALVKQKSGYALTSTRVKVRWARDIIADADGKGWTGRKLTSTGTPGPGTILYFLGGELGLKNGVVKGSAPDSFMPGDFHLNLAIKGYSLHVKSDTAGTMKGLWHAKAPYALYLIKENQKQLLLEETESLDKPPRLLWQGDLDRDGKIDLILDTSVSINLEIHTLYLSSFAKPNELVGKVAEMCSTGC